MCAIYWCDGYFIEANHHPRHAARRSNLRSNPEHPLMPKAEGIRLKDEFQPCLIRNRFVGCCSSIDGQIKEQGGGYGRIV